MSSQYEHTIRSSPAERAAWQKLSPQQRRMCQDSGVMPSEFAAAESLKAPLPSVGPDTAFIEATKAARHAAEENNAKQVADRAAHEQWQAGIAADLAKGSK